MLIRIVLLAALAAIGWLLFLRRNKLPVHILVMLGMLALGAYFVIAPEASNTVAHYVGVGRGADLITYLVEVGVLFVILHYYTKFVELQRNITELVREVALLRSDLEETRRTMEPAKAQPRAPAPSERSRAVR
jgi:small membrane protein